MAGRSPVFSTKSDACGANGYTAAAGMLGCRGSDIPVYVRTIRFPHRVSSTAFTGVQRLPSPTGSDANHNSLLRPKMEIRLSEIDFAALTNRTFFPSPATWEDEVLYFLIDRKSDV